MSRDLKTSGNGRDGHVQSHIDNVRNKLENDSKMHGAGDVRQVIMQKKAM